MRFYSFIQNRKINFDLRVQAGLSNSFLTRKISLQRGFNYYRNLFEQIDLLKKMLGNFFPQI